MLVLGDMIKILELKGTSEPLSLFILQRRKLRLPLVNWHPEALQVAGSWPRQPRARLQNAARGVIGPALSLGGRLPPSEEGEGTSERAEQREIASLLPACPPASLGLSFPAGSRRRRGPGEGDELAAGSLPRGPGRRSLPGSPRLLSAAPCTAPLCTARHGTAPHARPAGWLARRRDAGAGCRAEIPPPRTHAPLARPAASSSSLSPATRLPRAGVLPAPVTAASGASPARPGPARPKHEFVPVLAGAPASLALLDFGLWRAPGGSFGQEGAGGREHSDPGAAQSGENWGPLAGWQKEVPEAAAPPLPQRPHAFLKQRY